MNDGTHILIEGNTENVHVGAHLSKAARMRGLKVSFCDSRGAYAGPRWIRALAWRCGHRPPQLTRFSNEVLKKCQQLKPVCLLTTGLAPVRSQHLTEIGNAGTARINFLTDDP